MHKLFKQENWGSLRDYYSEIVFKTGADVIQPVDFSSKVECETFIAQQLAIYEYRQEFENTNNPLCALDAFRFAYQKGYDIPSWVTTWLYNGLSHFGYESGLVDLSTLLGFKVEKRSGSDFKRLASDERIFSICADVYRLRLVTQLSVKKCSEIVRYFQFKTGYKRLYAENNLSNLAASSIATIYNENKELKYKPLLADEVKTDEQKLSYFSAHLESFEEAASDKESTFCEADLNEIFSPLQ